MIFEVATSILMGGVAGYAYLKQNGPATNEPEKIQKIFDNVGWSGRNGETIRLHRKTKFKGGVEYVYQLPLGFNRKEIERNKHILEDGLNVKSKLTDFDKSELLRLNWKAPIIPQVKQLVRGQTTKRKEIELDFDGMLRITVYNEPIPDEIDWEDQHFTPGSYAVTIGVNRKGIIKHDFDKRKSLLLAGVPGSGKSAIIKAIITALIIQNPENVTFSLIDLKEGAAFSRFRNAKQVTRLGCNEKEAMDILKEVKERMDKDFKKIVDAGFEDVTEAKTKKRHFLIIDEAADLADKPKAMELITDIVRKGRGGGYYVIYATQYPSMQAVSSQIKRNIPARLSFVLDSGTASTTVLDTTGAEDLPDIPGRGIYKDTKTNIIQAPYMTNKQIEKYIDPHIRKGEKNEQASGKTAADRKHSLNFKKV